MMLTLLLAQVFCLFVFSFLFFFLALRLERRAYTLRHSTSPIFVMGIFEIGSHELFAQGWLWTAILLISASWVARITGVSHRHPATFSIVD
jgi:hypothetical protein